MFTRNKIDQSFGKCYCCNSDLTQDEVCSIEFNDMCEKCYTESMYAAYGGLTEDQLEQLYKIEL